MRRDLAPEVTDFHGIITVAPEMQKLFRLLERVARTDSTILIRGQTGTGKELVARAIHALSGRARGPFRALNCATLTPELLASELFGHVRGAFTGAFKDRTGLFALADGGTVFLDEIAELPLELQARLLRVLQERNFVPVGGTEPVQVDIRLLSATNKALRQEVKQRRFREDLMYRVRVVPLFLPPLCERTGDVAALAWHFIEAFNRTNEREIDEIDRPAMEALLAYPWPGNVRELRNVIEYAFAVGEGPVLTLDQLTPELRGEPPEDEPLSEDDGERRRIHEALRATGGQKARAAELLGMSRSTLWRKLREHRIIT
ncbi:sigma-54 interaction domain-containing protein [Haliangium sp.]|uniref:sigma-54 interaction domain-containing protein n=1 Tax=Haliangium sp. TaxID=2663208 RepID=UPI003D0C3240